MTIEPANLFASRVPRYTSYPTAPHFHAGINAGRYRQWLQELENGLPLSLYCHIPFCDTLCWFCACHTTVVNGYSPVAAYRDYLFREIELVSAELSGPHPVTHIQWGGGSPTMLAPADIASLARKLRMHFDVAKDCEFAVEIDPRGFTEATAQALVAAGLTRASIGLQDSDPKVQHAINRIQSEEETAAAVRILRKLGVTSINLDLVYGLPHQTGERFRRTVEFALSLEPDRVAIFGYAHVPHFKKHQKLIAEEFLPDLQERFSQVQIAQAMLEQSGYVSIGLDHFARKNDTMAVAFRNHTLARNFQGYTSDSAAALIGLGASAISWLPQGYVQNVSDVPHYRKALKERQLPVARGIALADTDRLRRHIIEELMCYLCVDLDAAVRRFGTPHEALDDSIQRLRQLQKDGVVVIEGGRLTIPPEWRAATRLVCAAFDTNLNPAHDRHALAV